MLDDEDNYDHFADMIPTDGMPICGFRLLGYMNDSGQTLYRLGYEGDAPVSQLIGLIEMAKHDLAAAMIARTRGEHGTE